MSRHPRWRNAFGSTASAARGSVLALTLVLGAPVPALAAATSLELKPALTLEEGSTAHSQLVALGRDLVIAGTARSDVAALNGTIHISGSVEGDAIALAGDIRLLPSARVSGDVVALGGSIEAAPGAEIGGRSASYPTASRAWLTLLEAPTLGLSAVSPVVIGAKLGLMAAWMTLVLACFAASGREILSTASNVRDEPFRDFFVGLVGVTALLLTALLFSGLAAVLVGVPMLSLVLILALILKLWGMVAVFHALGDWLVRHLIRRRLSSLNTATLGLLLLGAVKFVPYLGIWTWTVASLIGMGAALSTKFGRREPWFQAAT